MQTQKLCSSSICANQDKQLLRVCPRVLDSFFYIFFSSSEEAVRLNSRNSARAKCVCVWGKWHRCAGEQVSARINWTEKSFPGTCWSRPGWRLHQTGLSRTRSGWQWRTGGTRWNQWLQSSWMTMWWLEGGRESSGLVWVTRQQFPTRESW